MDDSVLTGGMWVGLGSTLTADFRADARGTMTWGVPGQFAVGGFEIQHLAEPAIGETARVARSQANSAHRHTMRAQMQRVLQALYRPAYFRGHGRFDVSGVFSTVDLRLTNLDPWTNEIGSRLRCYLLAKVTLPAIGVANGRCEATRARAIGELDGLLRRLAAVFPKDVEIRRLHFVDEVEESARLETADKLALRPESVGLRGCAVGAAAEIRRRQIIQSQGEGANHQDFVRLPLVAEGIAIPDQWPEAAVDLLPTCAALSTAPVPLVLSVRITPVEMTPVERRALAERRQKVEAMGSEPVAASLRAGLNRFDSGKEWFQCHTQLVALAANDSEQQAAGAVEELAVTFMGEHTTGAREQAGGSRLARVRAIEEREILVAQYNLQHLQMLPWGPVYEKCVHLQDWVDGARPGGLPPWGMPPTPTPQLKDPDEFLQRDWNQDRRLMRLRELLSFDETAAIFQLPIVPAGGQAGLVSRIKNPFEQLPAPSERKRDMAVFGKVQHRFLREPLEFSMPLVERIGHVSGILDRVMVVAGSPGSGKTNFCLAFLRQLYREESGPRHPFLVIDPTRGNEFRALRQWIPTELVVFTVGDDRCNGFCFNPFLVPRNVSVQAHISRLMSCFKAAYSMWDPLPAIFEMALRLAYEGVRRQWWEGQPGHQGCAWAPAIDFPESIDEPFPVLDDVVAAMGKGDKDEKFRGRPTVMNEQRVMWGEGTENSATIVASTFLRLNSLRQNYAHILGGPHSGRPCVNVEALLEKPVVLELGMVGDSQALSLIMGFLIVSLAGVIERPPTAEQPKKHRLLIMEEAHRLLAGDAGGGGKDSGNSKAQAADDINNMLAEVRKYGLGVMLLDQRPASLVGGVIDNAYVVAMHRLNEEKSFAQFSKVLNLTADQQRFARTELRPGEFISLDRRSGLPVLMQSENLNTSAAKITDPQLREEMLPRAAGLWFGRPSQPDASEETGLPGTPLLDALRAVESGILVRNVESAQVAADSFFGPARTPEGFETLMHAVGSLRRKLLEYQIPCNDSSAARQQENLLWELLAGKPNAGTVGKAFLDDWRKAANQ